VIRTVSLSAMIPMKHLPSLGANLEEIKARSLNALEPNISMVNRNHQSHIPHDNLMRGESALVPTSGASAKCGNCSVLTELL
jgi:hypothetical protein